MYPKCAVSGLILAVFAALPARAQVTVDVTKINCDQFVHHKISEPRLMAAWFSGYYNAKRNNRVLDLQTFEEGLGQKQVMGGARLRISGVVDVDVDRVPSAAP